MEGIQERHTNACPKTKAKDARCTCKRSYRGSVYDPRPEAKKNLYSGWMKDKAAAAKWRTQTLREIEAHSAAGISAPGASAILSHAWKAWITGAESGAISAGSGKKYKPSTLASYKTAWTKHLEKEFGHLRLATIKRTELQKWANKKAAAGMPRSTLSNALEPMRVLFRRALRNGEVATNPTTDLDLPSKAETEIEVVSPAQARALIDALPADEQALWATAFYAGLRRAELKALRCDDLDLDGGVLTVTRSWTQAEEKPKTEAGVRRVPLWDGLAAELKAHLKRTGRSGNDLVFGRSATEPFVPSTVRTRSLKAWKDADPPLDPVGLHQCRHTFASFLIESGANAKALSTVMGHASIEITFNTYGHLMPGAEQEVGRLLGEYLRGNEIGTADT
jgi:integrase